ncbi:hypothetical protein [Caballeronia sp. LZ035]|uniref:hypothetical protein n=1 Tax=Caballeronia sp. LZ035 TaxID=3038568 RepID=UPI0028543563|nr:hypothetical protein [Caballeronia sp. LZ035]MDR5759384.1 hypothetical protein [Caballeronia sp. LZ035]
MPLNQRAAVRKNLPTAAIMLADPANDLMLDQSNDAIPQSDVLDLTRFTPPKAPSAGIP